MVNAELLLPSDCLADVLTWQLVHFSTETDLNHLMEWMDLVFRVRFVKIAFLEFMISVNAKNMRTELLESL